MIHYQQLVGITKLNLNMISLNKQLILADLKSWAKTVIIFVAPFALMQLGESIAHYDLGEWGYYISFALGALIKLAQKYQQMSVYKTEE